MNAKTRKRLANVSESDEDIEDDIAKSYHLPPHPTSFSGVQNVSRHFSISEGKAAKILAASDVYGLHREYKKPRVRNPFYIRFKRQQLQVDLIEMQYLADDNDGVRYLVCCIDCFTKFLWVRAVKTKSAVEVLTAMKSVIRDMGEKPREMFCDRGTELKNKLMRKYLDETGIELVHPNSEIKAGIVERVNKSLQSLIYKYLTYNETRRYVDALPDIVSVYNNRPHRSIDHLTPTQAEDNRNLLRLASAHQKRYSSLEQPKNKITLPFRVGDVVRYVVNYGDRYNRGYEEQFSRELCYIDKINRRMDVPSYSLRSMDDGEPIHGLFYKEELQARTSNEYKIERVLQRRVRNGIPSCFVKWLDFSDAHNSWIPETHVTREFNDEEEGDDEYGLITPERPSLSSRNRNAKRGGRGQFGKR